MLLVPLLATNSAVPEGARSIAEGALPAATSAPLFVSSPVLRSMLKDETDESPWVATNKAPVPEDNDEPPLLQALRQSSKTGTAIPASNRNLVPIRFVLPVLSQAFRRGRTGLTPVD